MATYTSNYGWTKPSGSDNVDISVLNDNLDDQDSTIHDAFLNMAPPFSELSTYAVDDIVLYTTGLYKCHTAVVTPGSWTGSTNWQVYKLSEGGGGGLTLGETSSTAYRGDRGKTAYDHSQTTGNPHGTTAADVGLGNVPNVSTNDQEPTFTEASTRNNIASGEKLSVILGKIAKFFNDLKTVAFSGSFSDLTNKPENANTFQGTIAEWNQLSTAEKKAYDHASIPDSIDGGVTFPADKVIMTGGGNVEDELGTYSETTLSITGFNRSFQFQKIGKIAFITYNGDASNLPKGVLSFSETIPLAYRPKIQTRIYSVDTSESGDSTVVMLVLNTDGSISGYRYGSAITTATQCRFGTISYIAAN